MDKITIFDITNLDDNFDGWEEVYNLFLSDLEHLYDELYKFKPNYKINDNDIIYLVTNGCPEGGYIILKDGKIFEVTRNWMTTFNFRNVGDYKRLEIGTTGETLYCKIN